MMRHRMTWIVIALMLIPAAAWAERGPGVWSGAGFCWDCPGVADDLGLTDDQLAALKQERDAFFAERDRLRETLRAERMAIRDLLAARDVDLDAIKEHDKKIAALRTELEQKITQHMLAVRKILSPEQMQKLNALPRSGKRHGRGPGW